MKRKLNVHPFKTRYNCMHDRCYNENLNLHDVYGGRGIKVDPIWNRSNPNGFANYCAWIEEQLLANPSVRRHRFIVLRNDVNRNYGPDNCCVSMPSGAARVRRQTVLSAEKVIEMRRYVRQHEDVTLTEIATHFEISLAQLSRSVRGATWSSVNHIEPPIKRLI